MLQEQDPSGELECCVQNIDIGYIYCEPAYWDGCLQVLKRDSAGKIIGAKYMQSGTKVVIHPLSIMDGIDREVFVVEYDEKMSESKRASYESAVQRNRDMYHSIKTDVEKSHFLRYVNRRLSWMEEFEQTEVEKFSAEFFDTHLSYKDLLPEDLKNKIGISFHDRRETQWDREISIELGPSGEPVITKIQKLRK